MANGPLGGFMPTPPSPGQPPQVKLETSAESRGAFNKFLGTLPSNGAVAPIQTGVVPSSTAPVSPMTSNVNIFQPQMSQMAPMPMMPPAQPVQNFFMGGAAMSGGGFSDADIGSQIDSFDSGSNNDDNIDDSFPDSDMDYTDVFTDDELQQATDIGRQTGGDDDPTPVVDTRPRTNIRNVGPTSNLRFDPNFALRSFSRSTGTPVQELLDRGYGERFGIEQPKVGTSFTPANLSTGLKSVTDLSKPNQFVDPNEFVAPVSRTVGTGTGQTRPVDLLGLGDLGFGGLGLGRPNELQELRSINRDLTNRISDLQPEVNPASVPLAPAPNLTAVDRNLTGISGIGADLSSPQSPDVLDNQFTQIAGLPTIVPGAGGTLPDADPLSTDVIGAIRSGAAGLPFTNNPGALKQGQPDLTTEVIKTLPDEKLAPGQKLSQDFLAPAIFNTLEAGIGGIDRQLSLYANKPGANITTPAALANTYLGSGNKENSARNRAAYIDAIKNVAGEKFDLNDPTTRDNISKAIANQEFGSAGAKVMDEIRGARTVLDNFNLDQLRLNEPLTSNVDQLGTLDPIGQTRTTSQIPDVLPDISQEFFRSGTPGGNIRSGTTQIGPGGRFTFSETPGRFLGTLGGRTLSPDVYSEGSFDISDQKAPTLSSNLTTAGSQFGRGSQVSSPPNIRPNLQEQVAKNIRDSLQNQADIDAAALSLGIAPFTRQDTGVSDRVRGTGDAVENLLQAGRREELLNRGQLAERDKMVQEMEAIDREPDPIDPTNITETALGGRGTAPTTDLTRGPQVSIVGDDPIAPLETKDIVGDITQERVADILNRPDRFKETFKIGDVEFPNLIATLANKAGSFFDRRLFDGIVKKGLDAVVDPDTGRIIGAKDEFGNLIEGRDLEQFRDEGGDSDPIGTFLRKATEDKKEEKDTTPNVFGGGTPRKTLENVPTVVSSPFQATDINFRPVGFDAGNLNKIIERITGVPSPRGMQEGGTVTAVDRFLSKVA